MQITKSDNENEYLIFIDKLEETFQTDNGQCPQLKVEATSVEDAKNVLAKMIKDGIVKIVVDEQYLLGKNEREMEFWSKVFPTDTIQ